MAENNSIQRILYIPFDHLHREHGALKFAEKSTDLVLFVESQRMVDPKIYHPVRLYFLISSAQHFANELMQDGFTVRYQSAPTTKIGISQIQEQYPEAQLFASHQSSYRLEKSLEELNANFCDNDFFLTPRELFHNWAVGQKSYVMESFYRLQRKRLNLLIDDGEPVGGQWNFDKENREKLPKDYKPTPYHLHAPDQLDQEIVNSLEIAAPREWATTRAGALEQLQFFLDNHFENFGRYEDAMSSEDWAVHHSLISPYINNGLLHPWEVLKAAIEKFNDGKIPIASCEAFIRQIIGWREYINGMYWHLGEQYRKHNNLNVNRKLLPLFTDSTKTKMNCAGSIVKDVEERSWVHHIPRLMVLSNLALIAGVNPQQFLEWMRRSFIDASDWVMVPNVIGMGVHADGGLMMTKPYASGGAYISRMSDYCKGCKYDPKKRVGEDACPFTNLYWNFIATNKEVFSKNHRMFQQLSGLNRLTDLPEVLDQASSILTGLENGTI